MHRMPVQPGSGKAAAVGPKALPALPARGVANWRHELPTLSGSLVTLRELRPQDASSLLACMGSEEVSRFISPPPATVEGFERFISWVHREREAARFLCFAVVPRGGESAVGVFQLRSLEPDFAMSEWGFALAAEYWGTGMFTEAAELVIDFAFDVVGAHRLEARAALRNARGNAALRKMGAVREGILRRAFLKNGEYLDQALWTILRDEWTEPEGLSGAEDVVH